MGFRVINQDTMPTDAEIIKIQSLVGRGTPGVNPYMPTVPLREPIARKVSPVTVQVPVSVPSKSKVPVHVPDIMKPSRFAFFHNRVGKYVDRFGNYAIIWTLLSRAFIVTVLVGFGLLLSGSYFGAGTGRLTEIWAVLFYQLGLGYLMAMIGVVIAYDTYRTFY